MFNAKLLLVALLLVFVIIFSWFSNSEIISNNSEENLNILSPSRTTIQYSSIWWSTGTGAPSPFFQPRASVFWTLSLLEKAQVPIFLIQAMFLGFLMSVGMMSMYAFVKYALKLNVFVAAVSSLFYLLNIYSFTQVWKRFLYNGMISWAYLPMFLLLWFKWITTYNFMWLIAFLISSLIFTYTFAQPAFFLTFWIPAGILFFITAWEQRKDTRKLLKLTGFSILGFSAWIIVNIWWLYSSFLLARSWSDENFPKPDLNLNVLSALSRDFPLNEILLLRQSWYLGKSNDWYDFYHHPLIYLISIAILGIAVLGLLKLKGNNFRKYLVGLGLVGLFISKGSNFPLGFSFFDFIFSTFPFTAALRNPYEKFGLVWLLPYSIFFASGLYWLYLRIKNRSKRIFFVVITIFLTCGLLVYPMWNGDIFPPKHRVMVPVYYHEANIFLNSQGALRYFHVPFLDEGNKMTYNWGYVGEDPSEHIFDSENLSSAYIPLYNKTLKLLIGYFDNKYIGNIYGLLGIDYVLLQKDIIDPKIDFEKTEKQILSWQGFKKEQTFGKIELFKIDKNLIKPRVYAAGNIKRVNSLASGWDLVASEKWRADDIFVTDDVSIKNSAIPKVTYVKLLPTKYKIQIKKSEAPFVLVLNNTYDKLWEARMGDQLIPKHFVANGFANGWLVERSGDYQIEIILKVWPWE